MKKNRGTQSTIVRRLIRFLEPGDRVYVRGIRGRQVKRLRSDRKYVIEVKRGGKLKGYVNNLDREGKPVPKAFTMSMLNRIKHTKQERLSGQSREKSHRFRITNKKRIRSQLPVRVIREIRKRKGVAFGYSIDIDNARLVTPFIYQDGKLSEKYLRTTTTAMLLRAINSQNYRMSPLAEGKSEHKKIKRMKEAFVTLEFLKLEGPTTKKRQRCKKCRRKAHKGKCKPRGRKK